MCGGFGDWKEQDEALPPKAWGYASSLHFHVCPKANRTHTDMAFEAIGDKTRQDKTWSTTRVKGLLKASHIVSTIHREVTMKLPILPQTPLHL
ncbi:hypothetical protein SDJN03_22924, partial [Cucurbita argyrosperma subsp. sororia]